jgi:hypothetical protein
MTLIVVDPYSVSADVWAEVERDGEIVGSMKGFRKIFHACIINDTKRVKFSPKNCIAFTGDAEAFYEWMQEITTPSPTIFLSDVLKEAVKARGGFKVIVPCDEGAVVITCRGTQVVVSNIPFTERRPVLVFGGTWRTPNNSTSISWFEPFLQAHETGALNSTDVERFKFEEGRIIKDRILVGKEAERFMKRRRRPWGSAGFIGRRLKKLK